MNAIASFLTTKAAILALALGIAAFTSYALLFKRPKPPPEATFKPTMTVSILSKEALLRLMQEIRRRYSAAYIKLRNYYRKKRRNHPRYSEAYRTTILKFKNKVKFLLKNTSKQIMMEKAISEHMIISSFTFYEFDEDIEDMKPKLNSVINDAQLPYDLTLDKAKEVYTFSNERSSIAQDDSFSDFLIRSTTLEDELYEEFGYEIEEIEKAYEAYKYELKALETELRLQARGSYAFSSSLDENSDIS